MLSVRFDPLTVMVCAEEAKPWNALKAEKLPLVEINGVFAANTSPLTATVF